MGRSKEVTCICRPALGSAPSHGQSGIVGIVPANKKAVPGQLLRIREIDLPGLQPLTVEGVADRHKVRNRQLVGCLVQTPTGLLVQRWVIAEPDHHSAGIGLELEFVVAEEQRLDHRRRHHGLAGAGGGCERKAVLVSVLVPALPCVAQVLQNLLYGGRLIFIFERKLHLSPPHRETEIGQVGFVKPHGLNAVWQLAGNRLKAALVVGDDISDADHFLGRYCRAIWCGHIQIGQQPVGIDHLPRKHGDDCLQELRWLYDRRDLAEAKADLAAWLAKWSARYPRLTAWAEESIEQTLTFFRLPRQHHKHLKSTNMLERLNEEIRRRTYVVRIFPNAESCLRLVRALAVETNENWMEANRYINMDDLREHKKLELRKVA